MSKSTCLAYLRDSSLITKSALLIGINSTQNGTSFILDSTLFYPQGGGQPYNYSFMFSLDVTLDPFSS